MTWRLPAKQYQMNKGARNKQALRRLAAKSPAPGMLAYVNDEPVGWCSVAPREHFSYLSTSRVLRPIDDERVWSVSCIFILPAFRRQGISVRLLGAAVALAKREGARIVEGYPVIPYNDSMPPVFAWTGMRSAFVAAGFEEVARGSPKRPIMRLYLRKNAARPGRPTARSLDSAASPSVRSAP